MELTLTEKLKLFINTLVVMIVSTIRLIVEISYYIIIAIKNILLTFAEIKNITLAGFIKFIKELILGQIIIACFFSAVFLFSLIVSCIINGLELIYNMIF